MAGNGRYSSRRMAGGVTTEVQAQLGLLDFFVE
jgi:hypothetical protein